MTKFLYLRQQFPSMTLTIVKLLNYLLFKDYCSVLEKKLKFAVPLECYSEDLALSYDLYSSLANS